MVVSFDWFKYSVVFGFMKREIKATVMQDTHESGIPGTARSESQKYEYLHAGVPEDPFDLAKAIKIDLSNCVQRAAIKRLGKQELLLSLRNLLKPYTASAALQVYAFRVAISNAIEEEVKKYCSIRLNRQELLRLWQTDG